MALVSASCLVASIISPCCDAIRDKFAEWRSKRVPTTSNGWSLVVKSSALAKAWYVLMNLAPPDGINEVLRCLDKEAWAFFEADNYSSSGKRVVGGRDKPDGEDSLRGGSGGFGHRFAAAWARLRAAFGDG